MLHRGTGSALRGNATHQPEQACRQETFLTLCLRRWAGRRFCRSMPPAVRLGRRQIV
jgi:hypothetical protein